MKSDHIEGYSSFALVCIIPYTFHPMLPASSCICIVGTDLSAVIMGAGLVLRAACTVVLVYVSIRLGESQ
jgi:hypothetical protein